MSVEPLRIGLLAMAALVVLLGVWAADFLDLNKTPTYNDSECELLPDIGPGSEDIVVVDNNLVLVSAGDLDRIIFQSKRMPREGGMFAIHFNDENEPKMQTKRIPISGFPQSKTFNPHGLSFSNQTQRVYAVNHDCGTHVYEGIEIFRLVRGVAEEGDQSNAPPSLKLVYERSITSASFPLGAMNDVVEGAYLGELYVTQWLAGSIPEQCNGHASFIDTLKVKINVLFRRMSKVHRCVWDTEQPQHAARCSVVAEGFKGANGIASDPEKKQLFVIDAPDKAMHVFDRTQDGSLQLKHILQLPYLGDNVEFDADAGKLTMAGSPLMHEILGRHGGDASVEVSGGMITVQPLTNGSYIVEEVLMHDGSLMSQVSSAVFFHGKILLGSCPSDGVLVCPIPKHPISSEVRSTLLSLQ